MSGTLPTPQPGVLQIFCAGTVHAVFVHHKNGARPFHLGKLGTLSPKKWVSPFHLVGRFIIKCWHCPHGVCTPSLWNFFPFPYQVFCVYITPKNIISLPTITGIEPSDPHWGGNHRALYPGVLAVYQAVIRFGCISTLLIRLEIGSGLLGPDYTEKAHFRQDKSLLEYHEGIELAFYGLILTRVIPVYVNPYIFVKQCLIEETCSKPVLFWRGLVMFFN